MLVLAAVASVPAALTALWVQLVLLESDAFVDLSDEMLDEEDVRFAVRETIADEIETTVPEFRIFGLRPLVGAALEAAFDTAAFRALFAQSVASAHQQLADGEDEVEVRLDDVVPLVVERLRPASPELADALLARGSGIAVTLIQREEQPVLWSAFQGIRAGSFIVLAAAVGLAGASLVVSPARAQTLAFLGIAGAAAAAMVLLVAPLATAPFTDHDPVIGPGVDAAWGVVVTSADPIILAVAVVLGAAGMTGLILSLRR